MQHDSDKDFSLDRALVEAAAALLKEIQSEPVPQPITDLAEQLQAVLDKTLTGTSAETECTPNDQ